MSDVQHDGTELEEKIRKFSRPARWAVAFFILLFLYFIVYPITFEVFENQIGRALPGWAEEILDVTFWPIHFVIKFLPGYEEFLYAVLEFFE